jgi:hypothetical protein
MYLQQFSSNLSIFRNYISLSSSSSYYVGVTNLLLISYLLKKANLSWLSLPPVNKVIRDLLKRYTYMQDVKYMPLTKLLPEHTN